MKLKFNENGKFRILLFGDLHESYDYAESPKFRDMQKLMNANSSLLSYFSFPAGVMLTIPDVVERRASTLPPWKQVQR